MPQALLRVLPVACSPIRASMQAQGFQYIQVLSVETKDNQQVLQGLPEGTQFKSARRIHDARSVNSMLYYTPTRFPNLGSASLQLPNEGAVVDVQAHTKLKTLQLKVVHTKILKPILIPQQCLVELDMGLVHRDIVFRLASFRALQQSLSKLSVFMTSIAFIFIDEIDLRNFSQLKTLCLSYTPAWPALKLPEQ